MNIFVYKTEQPDAHTKALNVIGEQSQKNRWDSVIRNSAALEKNSQNRTNRRSAQHQGTMQRIDFDGIMMLGHYNGYDNRKQCLFGPTSFLYFFTYVKVLVCVFSS